MKWIVLVAIFFGIPFYMLNNFVMPELKNLENFYSNVDQIAQKAATNK